MTYQAAESAWRTTINHPDSPATTAEWLCSTHRTDTTGPVIRREVWLHGTGNTPVADYQLDADGNDSQVPAWVPRPPDGWDQFPITQAQAAAR